jgi:PAS domain S-box-containing protein
MKIRAKINFTFIVTALISFLILGYLINYYSLKETKRTISSYLYSSGRARAEHVITFIKDQKTTSNILAAASVYRDFLKDTSTSTTYKNVKQKIDDRLLRTIETDPSIFEAFLLDKNGKIVASSDKTQEGKDKSQDLYFINAKEDVYLKDVYASDTVNKLVYTISSPIKDNDGTLLGISVLRYLADNLYSIVINENGLGDTEENFLINGDRFLITPTRFLDKTNVLKKQINTENANNCFDKTEVDYITKNGYSGLKKITSHADAVENKDYRDVDVIGTHTYIPGENWCLITKVDKADALKVENSLIINFWLYIIISLIIFITIVLLFINRIIKSIFIFIEATKKYNNGDTNYKIEVKSKDEVGQLAESFNSMVRFVSDSRLEIDKKVEEQTKNIIENQKELEKQRTAILNILDDVKEEKNKAESLAFIVENADQAIIGRGLDGVIVSWNVGAEKLFGYKSEEMIGKKSDVILPEGRIDEVDEIIGKIISGGIVEHYQTKRVKKDGSVVDISLSISPIKNSKGQIIGVSSMALDITKEKEIDKAKTEFVSLASHQLRTPLSTINWYTEMILDGDVGPVSEDQKKYLDEIYSANKRMVDLVNSLLNVSKMDLGTFIIEPEPVSLKDVVKNVLGELQEKIINKKVIINEDIEELPKINLDPKLIHIIFQNILSNAVKYTHESGLVEISIKTILDKINGLNSDKAILIKVKDDGMGIPESEKNKVFSKLFRADNAKEQESEGTGLGLYLAKSIVENSGGKIWFESKENVGTTFFILIPFEGMKKKVGEKPLV